MVDGRGPSTVSVQRLHLLTLAACVALAIGVLLRGEPERPRPPPPPGALDAVPSGAGFVLTLDLAKLRETPLGAILLSAGRELPGVGRLDQICGFDPSGSVRELAIATPALGRELGIVATGEFSADRIATCAETVVRQRGGTPTRTTINQFVSVRDRARAAGEIAVKSGGPVLLGEGRYLRDMIDTSSGEAPSFRGDAIHGAVRRRLGEDAALLASWQFDEAWLERVTGEELARLSPLAAIRAVGVRVDAAPRIAARALIACSSKPACGEVASVLRDMSRDFGPLLRRELGDNPFEGARIELVDGTIEIALELGDDRALAIVRHVLVRYGMPGESAPPEGDGSVHQLP